MRDIEETCAGVDRYFFQNMERERCVKHLES